MANVGSKRVATGAAIALLALVCLGVAAEAQPDRERQAQTPSRQPQPIPAHAREVIGAPLGQAKYVVVLVHGINNRASHYDRPGGFRDAARDLLASLPKGESAVVTYTYAAPQISKLGITGFLASLVPALLPGHAERAAPGFATLMRDVRAQAPNATVGLGCHSYGCRVAGLALALVRQLDPTGSVADHVFTLGAPSLSVEQVSDLGLADGVRVYAAENPTDLIAGTHAALGASPTTPGFDDEGRVVAIESHGSRFGMFDAHAIGTGYLYPGSPVVRTMVSAMTGEEQAPDIRDRPPERPRSFDPDESRAIFPGMRPLGAAAVQSMGAGRTGGVDFSSLELRYLADASSSDIRSAAYAFRAPRRGRARGGRRLAARMIGQATDSFFVWLALPRSRFTVNLNPNEPNRIIDPTFARTSAGQILLEADLRMKRTVARLIHPRSRRGAQLWRALERTSNPLAGGGTCLSFRQWIVPGTATVRSTSRELYILRAPLVVRLESEYLRLRFRGPRALRSCPHQLPGVEERNELVYRRLILPRLQRAINHAPEYEPLRRVYASRVAAEWYRRISARRSTAFASVIDSGNITRWRSRRRWRPRDVFDRYLRSLRDGEFRVKTKTRRGSFVVTRMYVFGGVDFTSAPRRSVSAAVVRRRGLPRRLLRALERPAVDRRRREAWLAGASIDTRSALLSPALPSAQAETVGGYDLAPATSAPEPAAPARPVPPSTALPPTRGMSEKPDRLPGLVFGGALVTLLGLGGARHLRRRALRGGRA